MLIFWINKRKKKDDTGPWTSKKESFVKHEAAMEKFRREHPEMNFVNAKDIITADGDILALVQEVKVTDYMKN